MFSSTSFSFLQRRPETSSLPQAWTWRAAAKAAPTPDAGAAGASVATGFGASAQEAHAVSPVDRLELSPVARRVVRQLAADPRFGAFLERLSSDDRVQNLSGPAADLLDRLLAFVAQAARGAGGGSTGGTTGGTSGGNGGGVAVPVDGQPGGGGAGGAAGGGNNAGGTGSPVGGQPGGDGAGGAAGSGSNGGGPGSPVGGQVGNGGAGGAAGGGNGAGRGRAEDVLDELRDRPRGRSAWAPGRQRQDGVAGRPDQGEAGQDIGRFGGLVKFADRAYSLGGIEAGRSPGSGPSRRVSGMALAEMMRSLAAGRKDASTDPEPKGEASEHGQALGRGRAGERGAAAATLGQAGASGQAAQPGSASPAEAPVRIDGRDAQTTTQEVLRQSGGVSPQSFEARRQQQTVQLLDLMV